MVFFATRFVFDLFSFFSFPFIYPILLRFLVFLLFPSRLRHSYTWPIPFSSAPPPDLLPRVTSLLFSDTTPFLPTSVQRPHIKPCLVHMPRSSIVKIKYPPRSFSILFSPTSCYCSPRVCLGRRWVGCLRAGCTSVIFFMSLCLIPRLVTRFPYSCVSFYVFYPFSLSIALNFLTNPYFMDAPPSLVSFSFFL
jgi:hypothetical protein